MHKHFKTRLAAGLAVLSGVAGLTTAIGADKTYDFTTDPSSELTIVGNNDAPWVASGGNTGGFLAITYPQGGQYAAAVFPNLDPGKVVTGFTFTADLRVGNSTGDRAADGFSVSFARDGDPILVDPSVDGGFAGNCCAETGTRTGIAVSFDTWSGNTFPSDPNDTTDIEGIIVRVDNVTVSKTALPTRHGACDDNTSLQTGPRDAAYWANAGAPRDTASWAGLCWQPFGITLTSDGKLTVSWKGRKVLDSFQTTYFPTAGQIVLAGRTGGANEHSHFDNIRLVTEATAVACKPNQVTGLAAGTIGSRRATITWAKGGLPCDPNGRVSYEVSRDGVVVSGLLTTETFTDTGVSPSKSYVYTVVAKNIGGELGPVSAPLNVTTVADVDGQFFTKGEVYGGISGTAVDALYSDPAYLARTPSSVRYNNGFSFTDFADNYGIVVSGVFTAPKTGNFRFFVRSDDASALFVSAANGPMPTPEADTPIAVETGCCGGFEEPPSEATSEPISLTAGAKYSIAFVVKEGGGGDWGHVAIREEGDTTPAANLPNLTGAWISSKVDGAGASVTFTKQPVNQTVAANAVVQFSATATGVSPSGNTVAYHWYKNGQPLTGNAQSANYTIPSVSAADNGAKFKLLAGVAGKSSFSDEITLTVTADTVPPTILSVNGTSGFNTATVTWSEPVAAPSAVNPALYVFAGGLTVTAAEQIAPDKIKLTTSAQAVGGSYALTVNGVKDNAGLDSAASFLFKSFADTKGRVTLRTWRGQTGGFDTWVDVKDTPPTTDATVNGYFSGTGIDENYFGQLTGFFTPPADGNYVFYIAADDHAELYLSTDANPANKKRIAEEPQWGDPQKWNVDGGANSNTRDPNTDGLYTHQSNTYQGTEWSTGIGGDIALKANTKYYLEVLWKEGGGGDHGAATFVLKGQATPANGSTALTGDVVSTLADPTPNPPLVSDAPRIDSFPGHQTIAAGATATFSVVVSSRLPVTYQWYRNNKIIEGATSHHLEIPNAGVQNIGDYRVRVENANGVVTTSDNDSRLLLANAFAVEAEDYNYDGGKTVAAASIMPLASSLYRGLDGKQGIDINLQENNTDSGCCGNSLRNGWVDAGSTVAAEAGANVDVIADGNPNRGSFSLTQNYKIGWGDGGEAYNYTRDFPAGTYAASLGFSWDGRNVNVGTFALEIVTGDPSAPWASQTTTRVAEATVDQTGGWSSNDNIPFMKVGSTPGSSAAADLATFTLGAKSTVRLVLAGGDIDYMLFYPVTAGPANPSLGISVSPAGEVTVTFEGVLETADKPEGPYTPQPAITSPYKFTPGPGVTYGRARR